MARRLTKSEVRSQKSEVVFETEQKSLSQKRFALKGGASDPMIFGDRRDSLVSFSEIMETQGNASSELLNP